MITRLEQALLLIMTMCLKLEVVRGIRYKWEKRSVIHDGYNSDKEVQPILPSLRQDNFPPRLTIIAKASST